MHWNYITKPQQYNVKWKPNLDHNNLQTWKLETQPQPNNLQIGNPKNAIMWTLETQPQPNNLQIRNPTLTPTMYKLEPQH
jgi:hypothetical protein